MGDVTSLADRRGDEARVGLDELAREGARRMIAAALEAEIDEYLAAFVEERDEDGRRLGGPQRAGQAAQGDGRVGDAPLRAPWVDDRRIDADTGERQRFSSRILPRYARRSPKVSDVLPVLYLRACRERNGRDSGRHADTNGFGDGSPASCNGMATRSCASRAGTPCAPTTPRRAAARPRDLPAPTRPRRPATELTWLKVVVKHEAMVVRRARADSVSGEDVASTRRSRRGSVRGRAESGERAGRSAEALRKLKHDEALALMLKAEGYSYQEIGSHLSWTYTKRLLLIRPTAASALGPHVVALGVSRTRP